MMDVVKTFNEINVYGPSGREDLTREAIKKIASQFTKDIKTDAMGNLICRVAGKEGGKKIMFSAHMDSIGLIATVIEDGGYIRFGKVGGVSPYNIVSQPVVFANGTKGFVGVNEDVDWSKLSLEDMFIDIGAKDKADAEKQVKAGDMAVYVAPTYTTSGGFIVGPYLDDRICCVAQLMAMEQLAAQNDMPENDAYFVFTVQEEVGMRGAKPAGYAVDPDYFVVCDVTHTDDLPKSNHHCSSKPGKGGAIKVMDGSVIAHPQVVKMLEDLAKKNKIGYQMDVLKFGGTDAGAVHVTRAGVPSSGVSISIRNCHRPQEVASIYDVEETAILLAAFAGKKF